MPEVSAPARVFVVCTECPPQVIGGLGRYVERMVAALRDLGTPVEVYGTTSWRRGAARRERVGDVTLHRVRTVGTGRAALLLAGLARIVGVLGFNLAVTARILRALRGGGAKAGAVVAVHDWMGCLAGILCGTLGRLPVVFHVHTREINRTTTRRRSPVAVAIAALETAMARRAGLIVVPSVGMRDDLVACGWPPARMRVVPHGFDDADLARLLSLPDDERERQRCDVRHRYLPGGEGTLIVFAGRFSEHKGVATLVRATPRLVRGARRPGGPASGGGPLRVVLVGAEAPRTGDNARIARLIRQVGVAEEVVAEYRFRTPPEVYAHLLAADVCVFPSTYEPFGLVAIEAMALGRPVVVGPGYSAEVVGDAAVRCRDGSRDELADAVLGLLADPRAAARLGRRGAAHVRERYGWRRTATVTLATYAEAVDAERISAAGASAGAVG